MCMWVCIDVQIICLVMNEWMFGRLNPVRIFMANKKLTQQKTP